MGWPPNSIANIWAAPPAMAGTSAALVTPDGVTRPVSHGSLLLSLSEPALCVDDDIDTLGPGDSGEDLFQLTLETQMGKPLSLAECSVKDVYQPLNKGYTGCLINTVAGG